VKLKVEKTLVLKKILLHLVIVAVIFMAGAVSGASFFMKNIYTPETILKTAVKKSELNDLSDNKYILCKKTATTGFDWIMVEDENGKKTYTFCNIFVANPVVDLNLNLGWVENTFIFYIEEKKMVYSEATKQEEIEYIATEWDILYPIKRDELFDLFNPKKYLTSRDVRASKE
jgi:hypothetical protein